MILEVLSLALILSILVAFFYIISGSGMWIVTESINLLFNTIALAAKEIGRMLCL
jgi:hypothetical protein